MINKIKNIILTLSAVAMILTAGAAVQAAMLSEYPCTVTQPDGTRVECFLNGDEYFGYLTDENGAVIVQNTDTGSYTYAAVNNGQLVSTENIIESPSQSSAMAGGGGGSFQTVSAEDLPEEYIQNQITEKKAKRDGNGGTLLMSLSENNTNTMGYNGKTLNNIVIFVEFKDTVFSLSHKDYGYYDGLFNTNDRSLKNYYDEVSYGKTIVNSVLATADSGANVAVYKSNQKRSYYESDYNLLHNLMDEAVKWAADNNYIPEDVNYDADGDGTAECVTFIFAGDVQTSGERIFWPQAWWGGYLSNDIYGKHIRKYFMVPEKLLYGSEKGNLFQKDEDILFHESFHAIFEGGDLYDNRLRNTWNSTYQVYGNAMPVRNWDIMSSAPGTHMSSYMKYRYGNWINIPEIKSSGTYTLKPMSTFRNLPAAGIENNTVAYVLRSSVPVSGNGDTSQYFIAEYRKSHGFFDRLGALQGDGLVIYRVNSNFDGCGNNFNTADANGSKYEIEEIYPKKDYKNLRYSNGTSSGIIVSNIQTNSDGTLSFTVSMYGSSNLMYFKDPRLADAVRTAIGKSDSLITDADIAAVTSLDVSIENEQLPLDLSGIEHMTGLTSFTARHCKIDDITPLQELTGLTSLDLSYNNIKDISVLSGKSSLRTLKLRGNLISDYSPVESYYSSITEKDFSLNGADDFVFRIPNVSASGNLQTVYAKKGEYMPDVVYGTIEMFNHEGVLLKKRKLSISIPSTETQLSLYVPNEYSCSNDGSYIVLSAYERADERQQLSRITIKPSYFNLDIFK